MSARRTTLCLFVLLVAVAAYFLGPVAVAGVLRRMAAHDILAGRLGPAQSRLAWAAWLTPGDDRVDLLQAACCRQTGDMAGWAAALEAARAKGSSAREIELEQRLGRVQSGQFDASAEREIAALTWLGATSQDLPMAVVLGLLAQNDLTAARNFLDAGLDPAPDEVVMSYLWGAYYRREGNFVEAQTRLVHALGVQPDHEPAREELAAVFEERGHFAQALQQYTELTRRTGGREAGVLGLARVLRPLGRFADARRAILPLAARPAPSAAVVAQMGQIETDLGNYPEAERWLRRLPLGESMDPQLLTVAACAFGLQGKTAEAERLIARIAMLSDRALEAYELDLRVGADPNDLQAAGSLQRLYATPLPPTDLDPATTSDGTRDAVASRGAELYAFHCSACHGRNGDGRGRAGRHLFPRPLNLRTGRCKLVSTRNGVPVPEDLEAVLRRGMPGTSMPAFDHLSKSDRKLLVQEVLRFQREGMREQLARFLQETGEEPDEAAIQAEVDHCTTPGEIIRVPSLPPAIESSIARGKNVYRELGCHKCHGDEGRFSPESERFDDQGYPSRPRDLVCEPFKGGRDPESIYLRISAGMPGTDHPAVTGMEDSQLIDLVQYVRSLAREPERSLTNHERWAVAEPEAYRAAFGESRR